MTDPFFPALAFAGYVGPVERSFALTPRKLWNGRWVWLRWTCRRSAVVHTHLSPGGGSVFWVYAPLPRPSVTGGCA